MARCPDCNKFVSYDDGDVDVQSEDVESGEVRVEVRIVKTCAECGTELKEANFDLESDFTDGVAKHLAERKEALADAITDAQRKAQLACTACAGKPSEHCTCQTAAREAVEDAHEECELEAEVEAEMSSRTEGKGRGLKTFYGYHATVTLKCSCGGIEAHRGGNEHDDDMQASQMDELT